jgi:hypothetical protein
MTIKLSNAFSLSMISSTNHTGLSITPVSIETVKDIMDTGVESFVGHTDTAAILTDLLGIPVPFNRTSLKLVRGDTLVVAQYTGPRMAEGTKTLPEGASFTFFVVTVALS